MVFSRRSLALNYLSTQTNKRSFSDIKKAINAAVATGISVYHPLIETAKLVLLEMVCAEKVEMIEKTKDHMKVKNVYDSLKTNYKKQITRPHFPKSKKVIAFLSTIKAHWNRLKNASEIAMLSEAKKALKFENKKKVDELIRRIEQEPNEKFTKVLSSLKSFKTDLVKVERRQRAERRKTNEQIVKDILLGIIADKCGAERKTKATNRFYVKGNSETVLGDDCEQQENVGNVEDGREGENKKSDYKNIEQTSGDKRFFCYNSSGKKHFGDGERDRNFKEAVKKTYAKNFRKDRQIRNSLPQTLASKEASSALNSTFPAASKSCYRKNALRNIDKNRVYMRRTCTFGKKNN
ncbi:hypothetical protein MHBO_001010, partial [Bonamia ostreae]